MPVRTQINDQTTMGRPIIGVLMDYQKSSDFSQRPHYALRCSYFDAVWAAGGLPVALPYLTDAIDAFLARCDGLILPGGFYPFPAEIYGETPFIVETPHPRYIFERNLAINALKQNVPTLGICAGMQIMASVVGATLYRDVQKELPTEIDHLNKKPAEELAHGVSISTGTQLHKLLGRESLQVNTAHKEALKSCPNSITINAQAEDGVVEGIEFPGHRFYLGVQWHPEFFAIKKDPNLKLFTALIEACEI